MSERDVIRTEIDKESEGKFMSKSIFWAKSILIASLLGAPAGTICSQQPTASSMPSPASSPTGAQKTEAAAPAERPTSVTAKKTTPLTIEQIRTNLPQVPAERFEFLRRQRKVTLEAIDESASQAKTIATSIVVVQSRKDALDARPPLAPPVTLSKERMDGDLQRAKNEAAQLQQKLDAARIAKPQNQVDIAQLEKDLRIKQLLIDDIGEAINRAAEREKTKDEDAAAMKAITDELTRLNTERESAVHDQLTYQRLLGEIDDMVNQLFIASDATNTFKLEMSIILSILIAVVIAGFFIVAWSDVEVKRKIFSNEAGIQFITMFAIVISVILFGIIGVLESKELSALLGGLSGYILGRKS